MLLVLDDVHKRHLDLLKGVDTKVIKEFCRISVEHLHKGSNLKVYQSASQRLEVDVDIVQNAITGIMKLFTEASKMKMGELEFRDSLTILGFNEECQEEIIKCYLNNNQEIRSLLLSMDVGIPHYRNIDWRLEVQIASRCLRRATEPTFLLKLNLEEGNKPKSHVFEMDPVNLIHMTEVLDQALQESKSQHYRRITRNVK